ncbi:GlsB/YeaQ/YmgE family stress response membrane protein [Methylibium rhizosphaerae]|jgi:uncharacterized membrane protein YeaQ/YmgE (transglycosylase-associated protein family)|uniref:GlsB/YeaQ/YmgE family stress response membrane protein n=1 Tax=Methylibium rhizosphaerae TaxID=2570323 RepID=UPI001125B5E2|nr:GlsB/YeaQ/YmgE family stress response membrane protein [Methylibium rhizosphaerae]
MTYVWMALIGFVVGLIARAVMPGTQSMGLILTSLLGIAGAFIAGFLGQAIGFYAPGQPAGFIASVVGALILLFVVGLVKKGGSSS